MMKKADILAKLRSFPFALDGFWIVTGAALVLHGVREETSDIDMGCTKEAADLLEGSGYPARVMPDGNRAFKIGGDIEVFENWQYGPVVRIGQIPVLSLEGVREMKERLGREKDLRDVRLIDDFLAGKSGCGREESGAEGANPCRH